MKSDYEKVKARYTQVVNGDIGNLKIKTTLFKTSLLDMFDTFYNLNMVNYKNTVVAVTLFSKMVTSRDLDLDKIKMKLHKKEDVTSIALQHCIPISVIESIKSTKNKDDMLVITGVLYKKIDIIKLITTKLNTELKSSTIVSSMDRLVKRNSIIQPRSKDCVGTYFTSEEVCEILKIGNFSRIEKEKKYITIVDAVSVINKINSNLSMRPSALSRALHKYGGIFGVSLRTNKLNCVVHIFREDFRVLLKKIPTLIPTTKLIHYSALPTIQDKKLVKRKVIDNSNGPIYNSGRVVTIKDGLAIDKLAKEYLIKKGISY